MTSMRMTQRGSEGTSPVLGGKTALPGTKCRPEGPDAVVVELAATQHGLVTRAQVRGAGLSDKAIRVRRQAGWWTSVQAGVYRIGGAPVTWEQHQLAALLAAGPCALASHRAALRLWCIGVDDTVEYTTPRRHEATPAGAVRHRIADVATASVSLRNGIRVTSPLRALIDAGAVCTIDVVERALDAAIGTKLVTVGAVSAEVTRLSRRGRRGVGVMRRVLERRGVGVAVHPSPLESPMRRLFDRFGLPTPAVELVVGAFGEFRLDFAYADLRIAIEVDGYLHHSSADAFQYDRLRQNWLVTHGWVVLRFTDADVRCRPGHVARTIRDAIELQRAVLGG